MMRRDARISAAWMFALLLLLLLPPAATADWGWGDRTRETETFDETVGVASDATVRVRTTNGNIEVETWDRDEVRIYAEKKAHARSREDALEMLAETEIRVENRGDGLSIEVDRPSSRGWGNRGGVSVSFRLSVPRGASIEARSTNGGIEVAGVAGTVSADTTNGGVHVEDVGGAVDIETTNGAIKAYRIGGALDARTTNGGIDAEVLADRLADDMRLTTTNGSIDLELAAGLAASVVARAGNGRVYNDLTSGTVVREKRNEAEVDLGGGGPRIEVRTANGRIRLREGR